MTKQRNENTDAKCQFKKIEHVQALLTKISKQSLMIISLATFDCNTPISTMLALNDVEAQQVSIHTPFAQI